MSYPLPVFSKPRARSVIAGPPSAFTRRRGVLSAAQILALTPAAWFRFNLGISNSGGFATQWDDQSGNTRHLKQPTATNQPAINPDGSLLFDGVDNFMRCDAFALNQPTSVYILGRQITWVNADSWCDGDTQVSGNIGQFATTPQLNVFAGAGGVMNPLTLNTYGAVCAVFNGASSVNQINGVPVTGNAGTSNMGGFVLGAAGNNLQFGNIEVKEIIIFPVAHDAPTRAAVITYLSRVGGI